MITDTNTSSLQDKIEHLQQEVARLKQIEEMLSNANRERQAEIQRYQRYFEQFKQQNDQLMAIINTAPDAIFIKDHQLRYALVNPAMEKLLGKTSDEILGRTDEEIFGDDENARLSRRVEQGVLAGRTIEEEHQSEVRGFTATFHTVKNPLRDAYGKIIGICGIARDITEHRLAEEARKRTEEQLTAIVDTAKDAIFIKDQNLAYRLVNPATERLFGLPASELLGKTDREIFGEEAGQNTEKPDIAVLEGNTIEEEHINTVRGIPITFRSVKAPMRNIFGEITGICGIARDITDQKLAERALHKSEAQYQALLNAIPDSMFQITKEGIIVDYKIGRQADKETSSNEFVGKTIDTILPAEIAHHVIHSAKDFLESNEIDVVEYDQITNGQLRFYEARIAAVNIVDDLLVIIRDITERKLAEEELKKRNEELDAFAHTVAHDLKSPLTGLMGFAQMLDSFYDSMTDENRKDCVRDINVNARRMKNIINELLLLASVRKQEVNQVPMDIHRVVSEVKHRLDYMIKKHQADILEPESWPPAMGYEPWIEEVLANYISNALKYGGEPPRVELGFTELENDEIKFWVKDNGEGLSIADQQRLFTEFTRLHQVRAQGQGLGLSIVQRIVEKLGGRVGVESKKGEGSIFYFILKKA
ncbi:MAG: PAS domain S-box protein [Gemmatimonadetes bacterium]|nr:MAG: PAS domain S-box protein [Gemmatimonadota bacterium]